MKFGKARAKIWDFRNKRHLKKRAEWKKREDERRQHKIRRDYGKHMGQVEYHKKKELAKLQKGGKRRRAKRFMRNSMRNDLTGNGRYSW